MTTTHDASIHLLQIAAMMQLDKANQFKLRAFREAAEGLRLTMGKLNVDAVTGAGDSIKAVLRQFAATGTSDRFEELAQRWPASALSMLRVNGVGPVTMMKLYNEGYHDFNELLMAAKNGKLNEKLTTACLAAEKFARVPHETAKALAQWVVSQILPLVEKAEVCGSIRRKAPDSKDVDIIAQIPDTANRSSIFQEFAKLGELINAGDTKSSIRVSRFGVTMQVDLWLVLEENWGAALNYATGSTAHNIKLRAMAKEHGMLINEYGIWRDGVKLGGHLETDIYQILRIDYVEPENR